MRKALFAALAALLFVGVAVAGPETRPTSDNGSSWESLENSVKGGTPDVFRDWGSARKF
jgi:hypothetical protein